MTDLTPPETRSGAGARVIMRMKFKDETDTKLWKNSIWESTGNNLKTSMPDFMSHLSDWILHVRHSNYREYEQHLLSQDKMIHTTASFVYGDVRDERDYIARDNGRWRLEMIEDLLLSTEAPDGEPIVEIDVWVGSIPAVPSSLGSGKLQEAPIMYHRYGTCKTTATETEHDEQQHEPMTISVLLPYNQDPNDETERRPILVPQRTINGVAIGRAEDHVHTKGEVDKIPWKWVAPYKDIRTHEERMDKIGETLQARMILGAAEESGVPRLPPVTFLPYQAKDGVDDIPNCNVSLAIRMVNGLQRIHAGTIKMPVDWLEVVDSRMTAGTLCKGLLGNVYDACSSERESRILEENEGRWRMDVWVMPQALQVEKLHFMCSEEQLCRYLDPVIVRSGERKLYVEIHLCVK